MAIRTVVTRGFGNGTFDGSIADAAVRGYLVLLAELDLSGAAGIDLRLPLWLAAGRLADAVDAGTLARAASDSRLKRT